MPKAKNPLCIYRIEERDLAGSEGQAAEEILIPVAECDDAAGFRTYVIDKGSNGTKYACLRQVGQSLTHTVVEQTKLVEG